MNRPRPVPRPRSPRAASIIHTYALHKRTLRMHRRRHPIRPHFRDPRHTQSQTTIRTTNSTRINSPPSGVKEGRRRCPPGTHTDRQTRKQDERKATSRVPISLSHPAPIISDLHHVQGPSSRAPWATSRWVRAYDSCKGRHKGQARSPRTYTRSSSTLGLTQIPS